MSRGFDGFEIDDFRDSGPGRDVSRGSSSDWNARTKLQDIHRKEDQADSLDREGRELSGKGLPPLAREERVQAILSQHCRTKYTDRDRNYSLRDSEIHTLSEVGKFRVVATSDLTRFAYNGGRPRMESDVCNLVGQGLAVQRGTSVLKEDSRQVRKGTADRYRSWILNHINPRWEAAPLSKIKPLAVELWLKGLNLAPKSKGHVRSVMHILFEWAMRWELMDYNRNPMSLLKLKGLTKRTREPRALSVEELHKLWTHLDEETRIMSTLATCLGLRASELFGLRWEDIDWKGLRVKIQRAWVYGRVEAVKTEGSEKWLPLDSNLADVLSRRQQQMPDESLRTGWVFVNPSSGKPWWPHKFVRFHLRPAAEKADIGRIGWHTFRHTYSTLLHAYGTDMKVQQELLRHSDIRTTMNIYTHTVSPALREANSKVVRMILPAGKTA